jgi:hypothetical protein
MFRYSLTKIENNNLEQRYPMKFCVRLGGGGAADIYEKAQKTFDNDSVSRAQTL